jgi:hypothetical protein
VALAKLDGLHVNAETVARREGNACLCLSVASTQQAADISGVSRGRITFHILPSCYTCASQDPIPQRVISDIHSMLCMCAFGIDASMTPLLQSMLGSQSETEKVITTETLVTLGIFPL